MDGILNGRLILQGNLMKLIAQMFETRGLVYPDGQDAATFCAQEAMEMVDCFLRRKNYVRNHEQVDPLPKEAAQTLMMLIVTCDVAGIDLEGAFYDLYGEYMQKGMKQADDPS